MVERRLSTPQEIKEKYHKVGVVIFIFNSKGEILVVQENSSSPETAKNAGDFGVICETSKGGESWLETTIRGLREELGIEPERNTLLQVEPGQCFLGESVFVEGVLARVVRLYWAGEEDFFFYQQGDGEAWVIGWEKPESLLEKPLRAGVRNVLQVCLDEGLFSNDRINVVEERLPFSRAELEKAEESLYK